MTREEITEWADSIEINEQADCYHDPFKAAERVAFLRKCVAFVVSGCPNLRLKEVDPK